MDLIIRHKRVENIFIGLVLLCPALVMDFIAIETGRPDFFVFTSIFTIFLGWFGYNYFKDGIQRRIIMKFDSIGVTSFDPEFNFNYDEIYGYKLHEYSGRSFKTLEIQLLFDNGNTSTTVDISWCDKKQKDLDNYLTNRLTKYSDDRFEDTSEKRLGQ